MAGIQKCVEINLVQLPAGNQISQGRRPRLQGKAGAPRSIAWILQAGGAARAGSPRFGMVDAIAAAHQSHSVQRRDERR